MSEGSAFAIIISLSKQHGFTEALSLREWTVFEFSLIPCPEVNSLQSRSLK
jgi:hypothetical protein